ILKRGAPEEVQWNSITYLAQNLRAWAEPLPPGVMGALVKTLQDPPVLEGAAVREDAARLIGKFSRLTKDESLTLVELLLDLGPALGPRKDASFLALADGLLERYRAIVQDISDNALNDRRRRRAAQWLKTHEHSTPSGSGGLDRSAPVPRR